MDEHQHDRQDDQEPRDPRELLASRALKPWKTEEEWVAVLAATAADLRPRDFALFEEYGDWEDAELVAWGRVDHDDHVTVDFHDDNVSGRFKSLESVQRLFCGPGKLRFVWVPQASPGS